MKKHFAKVDFRNGRYYIKNSNIRVDLVVGLGATEILKNYPWLSEKQVLDALDFAKAIVAKKGLDEETQGQVSAF